MSTRTGLSYPIPDDTRTKGPFKPMRFEATIEDCIVSHGEIPRELSGGFYRVGPTWRRPPKQGFVGIFAMDGMAQGLTFDNGRASFRNRWIRTPKFVTEQELGRPIFEYADGDSGDYRSWGLGQVVRNDENKGVSQGINIVNIFPFAGDVIASSEQGGPRSHWTLTPWRRRVSSRGPATFPAGWSSPPPRRTTPLPPTRNGTHRADASTAGVMQTSRLT